MATMPEKFIKQVKLGTNSYEMIPKFIDDGNGGAKDWSDIESLVTAGFTIEVPWTATDYANATAPTAQKLATVPAVTVYYNAGKSTATGTLAPDAEGVRKHIYLIYHPHTTGKDNFDEYVSTGSAWELIGNTDIDLSNYVKKGTYAGTAAEAGAHTHTVTGSVTIPTVSKTSKNLGISRSTDVALNTSSKATVLTGVKVKSTDNVLGEATTFTTTVTPTTTNIKATATGTAVGANGTAAAITGFGAHTTDNALGEATTFAVSGGEATTSKMVTSSVIPAVSNGKATNTVFGTDTTASKVTVTAGSDASLSAGAQASFTQGTDTFTQGSQALWDANVDTNGVLSFSFTANTLPTFSQGTDSFTANTLQTLTGGKATVVSATDVTVPVVSSNTEVDVAKAGTAVTVATGALNATGAGAAVATGISAISIAANKDDLVEAITALGAPTTANALTGVKVTTQPTIALATGATAGTGVISVATGITSATTTAVTSGTGSDIVAAATAVEGNGTESVLTAVSVSAQPVFALDGNAASGVAYVDSVTIGSTTASLTSGAAAEGGAHTHTTSVTL